MIKKGWFEHWNDRHWKYLEAIRTLDTLDTSLIQETSYDYTIAKKVYKDDLKMKSTDEFLHEDSKSKELRMIGPLPGLSILKLALAYRNFLLHILKVFKLKERHQLSHMLKRF